MSDWLSFLAERGARLAVDEPIIHGFDGRAPDTAQASVLCDLSGLDLLAFSGEDAQTFLQGQLTCDVREATRVRARRGALCTPKGRVLATFRLWAQDDGYRMALPRSLCEAIGKRLGMYVLRSRVRITPLRDVVRFGVAGSRARSALARALEVSPADLPVRDGVLSRLDACVIGLPGERYLVCSDPARAPLLWNALAVDLLESGHSAWAWRSVAAGDADVSPATQDQFVPQMLNLDLSGGIGFAKGCYTGQEIVARTQHLGRLKQRLYRCSLPTGPTPDAGTALYSDDFEGQASGMVLDAATRPDGARVVLAVLRVDTVAAGITVHCAYPDGEPLQSPQQVDVDLPDGH
ncbi:MAG: YgfZ/GcvT domain-containing protein [Pseudomonadota bacterium]|jgi:folate-binding protein YgfZ